MSDQHRLAHMWLRGKLWSQPIDQISTFLVHFWCTFGAFLVHFWCIFGAFFVHCWCIFGEMLVHFWCMFG